MRLLRIALLTAAAGCCAIPALGAMTLSFTNVCFAEGAGTLTNWGRVVISPAPGTNTTVALSADDPTELALTNQVIVLAGISSAAFSVTALDDAENDGPQTVTITAQADGYSDATGIVVVADTGIGIEADAVTFVPAGSVWKYLDDGSDRGTAWIDAAFDDAAWQSGPAELGYGDGGEATTNYYGPDPSNKYITTYYRGSFTVSGAAEVVSLTLSLQRDDGAVVYLNGTEAFRNNMPIGPVGYRTFATSVVDAAAESAFTNTAVNPALLVEGTNVLAVEIHQVSTNSSDISFNLQLSGARRRLTDRRIMFAAPFSEYGLVVSTNLTGNDFSGCCLMPATGELLIIRRNAAGTAYLIEVYDVNGTYHRTISLTGFEDTEGICVVDPASNTFAIAEEGTTNIVIAVITTNTTSIARAACDDIQVTLPKGSYQNNRGLEGMAYDPLNGWFYAVQEKKEGGVGQMGVYRVTGTGTNAVTEELFDAERVFAGRCTDLSDVQYDSYSGHLLILSDEGKTVFECDLSGNIVQSRSVAQALQPEGIAIATSRKHMYVASETNEYYRYDVPARVVPEGSSTVFRVVIDRPWTSDVTVAYAITSATAVAEEDYTPATGLVTIAAGSVGADFTVTVLTDTEADNGDALTVSLTDASCLEIIGDQTRTIVISNATPSAPVLFSPPFDCMETPDATPSFEFVADDPDDSAGIVYQIQWSLDPAFTGGVTNRSSDADAGFENLEDGGDPSPFAEGQRARFTVQPADAFGDTPDNTAWYWRVRAKDDVADTGSGNYGAWATGGSFRVNSSLLFPRWLQTADRQFANGTFNFTKTNGVGAVCLAAPSDIALNNVRNQGSAGTNRITMNNFAVASLTNRILLVGVSLRDAVAVTSVTFGASQLTELDVADNSGLVQASFWYLVNPPVTTATVTVRMDDMTEAVAGAMLWYNVDQATPFGTVATATGKSATASVDVSSAADEVVVDTMAVRRGGVSPPAAGSGQAQRWALTDGAAVTGVGGGGSSEPGAPSVTMSWVNSNTNWAIVAVPLKRAPLTQGTTVSSAVDFDWMPGSGGWKELLFTDDESNGDVRYDVQYWDGNGWQNTSITNQDSSPVDITGLNTGTCCRIRIKATLTDIGGTPYLHDWAITWQPPPLLAVTSAYSGAIPPTGTNILAYGTSVVCSVTNSPIAGGAGTQYVCTGWTGAGSVFPSGTATSTPPIVITNDSEITWQWATNYWVAAFTNGYGTVSGACVWVRSGSNVTLVATTNLYSYFVGWSGDTNGCTTNGDQLTALMTGPRLVSADFADYLATNDTPWRWLAQYYPTTNDFDAAALSDTDGDGMKAWQEYRARTNPENELSLLKITGLQAVSNENTVSWSSVTGRTYSVYMSTNLVEGWQAEPLTSNVPAHTSGTTRFQGSALTNGAVFYRISVE